MPWWEVKWIKTKSSLNGKFKISSNDESDELKPVEFNSFKWLVLKESASHVNQINQISQSLIHLNDLNHIKTGQVQFTYMGSSNESNQELNKVSHYVYYWSEAWCLAHSQTEQDKVVDVFSKIKVSDFSVVLPSHILDYSTLGQAG